MQRLSQKLIKFLAFTTLIGLILFVATGVVVAATVVHSGIIVVQVEEKGPDGVSFSAPVPASLVTLGAGLTRRLVDEADLADARQQLEPIRPILHELTTELKKAPSCTLVEVHNEDAHVLVVKDGRSLVIDIDSPDARVHVSFPITLAERVLNSILG